MLPSILFASIAVALMHPFILAAILSRASKRGGVLPGELYIRLRVLLASSVATSAAIAVSLWDNVVPADLLYVAAAVPISYLVLFLLARRVEGGRLAVLEVHAGGRRLRAIVAGRVPIAFTIAALGRVYVSLHVTRLPPRMVCSIVAHEHGHLRAYSPLPPQLGFPAAVLPAALASYLAVDRIVLGDIAAGLPALLGLVALWVVYSWTWELLADLYAATVCGPESVAETVAATSGSTPCAMSIGRILVEMVRSLRPVRVASIGLANPHPTPCLRQSVILALAGKASPLQDHPEAPSV